MGRATKDGLSLVHNYFALLAYIAKAFCILLEGASGHLSTGAASITGEVNDESIKLGKLWYTST